MPRTPREIEVRVIGEPDPERVAEAIVWLADRRAERLAAMLDLRTDRQSETAPPAEGETRPIVDE